MGLANSILVAAALENDWESVLRDVNGFKWIASLRLLKPFDFRPRESDELGKALHATYGNQRDFQLFPRDIYQLSESLCVWACSRFPATVQSQIAQAGAYENHL
jgi:hypothetical protein